MSWKLDDELKLEKLDKIKEVVSEYVKYDKEQHPKEAMDAIISILND